MKVFDSAGATTIQVGKSKRAFTVIAFGESNTVASFTMIDESRGKQAARIQLDATLDGKIHAIGTTTGVGEYSAVFFDGPICNTDSESAMAKYLTLSRLKDRQAKIYFYDSAEVSESESYPSSDPSATFSGILNNMGVAMVDDNGLVYIRVALSMLGSWVTKDE